MSTTWPQLHQVLTDNGYDVSLLPTIRDSSVSLADTSMTSIATMVAMVCRDGNDDEILFAKRLILDHLETQLRNKVRLSSLLNYLRLTADPCGLVVPPIILPGFCRLSDKGIRRLHHLVASSKIWESFVRRLFGRHVEANTYSCCLYLDRKTRYKLDRIKVPLDVFLYNLPLPLESTIGRILVTITGIEVTSRDEIMLLADCWRHGHVNVKRYMERRLLLSAIHVT